MLITPGKLLANINSPQDLKKLDQAQLVQLCEELRHFIIDNVSVYGGHFGASLGEWSLQLPCIMFSIHPTINWFGMWGTKLMVIKF
jgi:deoxyxylulose-5-phosphate synthase